MSLLRCIVSLTATATLLAGCFAEARPRITLGDEDVLVIVADDQAERSRGLQGYESLEEGEGMLFVFDESAPRTFAMKQVTFPIDVLFIGEDRTITAIEPLDPGETRLVSSPGPCPYVVELPQGWAGERQITVGDAFEYAPGR